MGSPIIGHDAARSGAGRPLCSPRGYLGIPPKGHETAVRGHEGVISTLAVTGRGERMRASGPVHCGVMQHREVVG